MESPGNESFEWQKNLVEYKPLVYFLRIRFKHPSAELIIIYPHFQMPDVYTKKGCQPVGLFP